MAHDEFDDALADMLPEHKDGIVDLFDNDSDDEIEAQAVNTQALHEADEIEVKQDPIERNDFD